MYYKLKSMITQLDPFSIPLSDNITGLYSPLFELNLAKWEREDPR